MALLRGLLGGVLGGPLGGLLGGLLRSSPHRSWMSSLSGNILLMGPPGAGKTTVGRMVAHRLGLPVIDVDDDVLEKTWKMPVSEKLALVGGEGFLQEEGQVLLGLSPSGSVVSLTGSNPLHAEAMRHVSRDGLVVYLDVDSEDIMERLNRMKVDRIIGVEAGVSVRDILKYRKQFYERWMDVRVLCARGEPVEEVVEKVLKVVERYHTAETYVSTRGLDSDQSRVFSDVVVEGLASDGGLYVPKHGLPQLDPGEWLRLADMSYPERALVLLEKCIHPSDVSSSDLRTMVFRAYGSKFSCEAVAPVKHLTDHWYVQELFHGPTASFKDLALQLMPQVFAHCLPPSCNFLVLVATSGDTGSAVLSGFSGLERTDAQRTGVLVFFPEDGVSAVQKLQMLSFREGNVRAVGVRSDFDFCQRSIKKMLGESGLCGHLAVEYGTVLSTANSINWARLLPQVVFHSSAYLDLCTNGVIAFGEPIDVCIPTGNFGNAMSAIYAKHMGVPIRRVLCASNHNHVVSDFIRSGQYDLRGRTLTPSHSPAIDILKSSNLERFLFQVSDGDFALVKDLFTGLDRNQNFRLPEGLVHKMQQEVSGGWCSEEDCLASIQKVHSETGYIMDPHTAVAKVVSERLQPDLHSCPVVISATAHYGKFAPAVFRALQIQNLPEDPVEQLQTLTLKARGPEVHRDLMRSLEQRRLREDHRVPLAKYGLLVEQVENMVQESFLPVS